MKPLLYKIFVSFLLLLSGINVSVAQTLKVAILDFENTSGITKYDGLGKAMSSMLITDIATNVSPRRLQIVERSQIQKILKEQNFQASSAVDKTSTVKAGKMLGVKYLLIGDIYVLNDALIINARFVDAETGDIKFSKKQEGKLSAWLSLKTNIAKELSTSISMPFTEPSIRDKEMSIATLTTFGNAIAANDAGDTTKALILLSTVAEFDPEFKYIDDLKNEIDLLKKQVKKNSEDIKELQKSGDLVVNATDYKEFSNNLNSELLSGREKWTIINEIYDKFPEQRTEISSLHYTFFNTKEVKSHDVAFYEHIFNDLTKINKVEKKICLLDLVDNILSTAFLKAGNFEKDKDNVLIINNYIERSVTLRYQISKPSYDLQFSKFYYLIVNHSYNHYVYPLFLSRFLDSFVQSLFISKEFAVEFRETFKKINELSQPTLIQLLFEYLIQNSNSELLISEIEKSSPLNIVPYSWVSPYQKDVLTSELFSLGSRICLDKNNQISFNNKILGNDVRMTTNLKDNLRNKIGEMPYPYTHDVPIKNIYILDNSNFKNLAEIKINPFLTQITQFNDLWRVNQLLKEIDLNSKSYYNKADIVYSKEWSNLKGKFKTYDEFVKYLNNKEDFDNILDGINFISTGIPYLNTGGICNLNGDYFLNIKSNHSNLLDDVVILEDKSKLEVSNNMYMTFEKIVFPKNRFSHLDTSVFKQDNFWWKVLNLVDKCQYEKDIDFDNIVDHLRLSNQNQLELIMELYEIDRKNFLEANRQKAVENIKGLGYFNLITSKLGPYKGFIQIDTQFYYKLSLFSDFERNPYKLLKSFENGYNNIIDTSKSNDRLRQLSNAIGTFANLMYIYGSIKKETIEINNHYDNGQYYNIVLNVEEQYNACMVNQYQALLLASSLSNFKGQDLLIKEISKLKMNYKFSDSYGGFTMREMFQNDFKELYQRNLISKELYNEVLRMLK